MRRRGLTLIEMLASLVLLATITAAAAEWLRLAAHLAAHVQETESWEPAARAVLQRLHDDLVTGASAPAERPARERTEPGVRIDAGGVWIRTHRAGTGPVTSGYMLDGARGWLRRIELAEDGTRHERDLLDHVREWSCTEEEDGTVLRARIGGPHGGAVVRRFRLP